MLSKPEDVPTEDGTYRAAGGIGAVVIREDGQWMDGNGNELALTLFDGATHEPPLPALEFLSPPFVKLVPQAEVEAAEVEIERIKEVLDNYLPTIITGLHHMVFKSDNWQKSVHELTEDEVAMRAALSAAHWIAKKVATGGGEALYDLPSVLDLMSLYKRERAKVVELGGEPIFDDRPHTARDRHRTQGYSTGSPRG